MDVPGIHCLSGKFIFISRMRDVIMNVISTRKHVGIFLLLCLFLLCHCLTSTISQYLLKSHSEYFTTSFPRTFFFLPHGVSLSLSFSGAGREVYHHFPGLFLSSIYAMLIYVFFEGVSFQTITAHIFHIGGHRLE